MLAAPNDQIGLFTFYLQQLYTRKQPREETRPSRRNTVTQPGSDTDIILQLARDNHTIRVDFVKPKLDFVKESQSCLRKRKQNSRGRYYHHPQTIAVLAQPLEKLQQQIQTGYSTSLQLKAHLEDLKTFKEIEPVQLIEELKRNQEKTIKRAHKDRQINATLKLYEISSNLNNRVTESDQVQKDIKKSYINLRSTFTGSVANLDNGTQLLRMRNQDRRTKLPKIQTECRKEKEKRQRKFKISNLPQKQPSNKWKNPTKCLRESYLEPIRNQNKDRQYSINAEYLPQHFAFCHRRLIEKQGKQTSASLTKLKKSFLTPKGFGSNGREKLI